jgi:hypothetical protein
MTLKHSKRSLGIWPHIAMMLLSIVLGVVSGRPAQASMRCAKLTMIEGALYDKPAGAMISLLSPEGEYSIVSSAPDNEGERWLLVNSWGSFIGWIKANQVKGHYLGACSSTAYDPYGRPWSMKGARINAGGG